MGDDMKARKLENEDFYEEDQEQAEVENGEETKGVDDSDDNSDSDEEDEDEEDDSEVNQLEEQISQYPTNYQTHVQYMSVLRKKGELSKLRQAREAMSALFPLTPTMWLEWTQDETRLLTDSSSPEEIGAIEALFKRGVKDYLSVNLWLAYVRFLEEYDPEVGEMTASGLAKIRDVFEQALSAGGLHLTEGPKLWEAYRELEIAFLTAMGEDLEEARKKQAERVRSLFRRQLGTPHGGHEDTLKEYLEWEKKQGNFSAAQELPGPVETAYKKAASMAAARTELEAAVASDKTESEELLGNYLHYVEVEEASGEPARAQVLYERVVEKFPIHSTVWLKYIDFIDSHLKVPVVIRSVYSRAVRNCPWVGALWSRHLLALERAAAPEEELAGVFEQALVGGLQTAEEYLSVFLFRADGVRRRIITAAGERDAADKQADVALLRATFNRASELLSTFYPDFVDRSLQLHSYWADLEARLAKDLSAARGVWESLLKTK